MTEVLTKLNPGELVGLLWTVGPIFCALVWIVLGHVVEYRRVSVAGALKKAMVERGMTAEEIRLVMDAGVVGQDDGMADATSNHSRISAKPAAMADLPADNGLTACIQSSWVTTDAGSKGSQAPCKGPAEVEV